MRLKDDEQEMLRCFAASVEPPDWISADRHLSILVKFTTLGFMNSDGMTVRGLHVASKLKPQQEEYGDVHRQKWASLDSEFRSRRECVQDQLKQTA